MRPEAISAIAAAISAGSALVMLYYYRKQGKGFIWIKDPIIHFNPTPDGRLHLALVIPIFNFGTGNIRFKTLKAKKIYLKNNSIENFEMDMDEAYFPPNVLVVRYQSPIYSDDEEVKNAELATQFRVYRFDVGPEGLGKPETQEALNKKLSEIGEVLVVLKCRYKDGSMFGFLTRSTTIAVSIKGLDINYLSTARRKELDKLFS